MLISNRYIVILLALLVCLLVQVCQSKTGSRTESEVCHSPPMDKEASRKETPAFALPKTITLLGVEIPKNFSKHYKANYRVKAPDGMVFVRGGLTQIGSETGLSHEKPRFWISVSPFFMDTSPVTVAAFEDFVKATGYITEAEKFGNAGIVNSQTNNRWSLKEGASWRYPQGKDASPAEANHPVTQVSWNDALAYCKWAKKRLPSELEWEHAAKNAQNNNTLYPFGNEIRTQNSFKANVWQGKFPFQNLKEDNFAFTSPVGYFGKTPLGLTDMAGNVWEWCQDSKQSYHSIINKESIAQSPEKVMRGGSFLCDPSYCHGYRVSARSFSSPETALFHVGFRCVQDIE